MFTKYRYSAFIDTKLDLVLKSLGVNTIVLVGLATNVCVESTTGERESGLEWWISALILTASFIALLLIGLPVAFVFLIINLVGAN